MKKDILFLLIIALMFGAFPTNIYAMEMKERAVVQEQQIVPFAVGDVLVKKYRYYQGKSQYRWWNKTKNCWAAGSAWINT